jgi:hypothetical protein
LLAPFPPAKLLARSGSGGTRTGGVAAAAALEHTGAAESRASGTFLLEATTITTFATLARRAFLAWATIAAAGAARRTLVTGERARSGASLLGSNVSLGDDILTKNTVDGGKVLFEVNNPFVGEGVIAPTPVELFLYELARQERLDKPQDVKVGYISQGAVSRAVNVVLDGNDSL